MTRHGFLARGLEPATGDGPLGAVDPAIALVGALLAALSAATLPQGAWLPLGLHATLAVTLATLSGRYLPLALRLAFVTPFMGGLLAMAPFHPEGSAVGLAIALWAMARGMTAALFLLTLTAVHPLPALLGGLGRLHVPATLIMVTGMTFRYLTTLAEEGVAMRQAATVRGYGARNLLGASTIGRLIGTLFLRSYERAERVHRAMLLRGWEGTPFNDRTPFTLNDGMIVVGLIALIGLMRGLG